MQLRIHKLPGSGLVHNGGSRYTPPPAPIVCILHVHLARLWDKNVGSCPTWSEDSWSIPSQLLPILYSLYFHPVHMRLGERKQAVRTPRGHDAHLETLPKTTDTMSRTRRCHTRSNICAVPLHFLGLLMKMKLLMRWSIMHSFDPPSDRAGFSISKFAEERGAQPSSSSAAATVASRKKAKKIRRRRLQQHNTEQSNKFWKYLLSGMVWFIVVSCMHSSSGT